jgi:hypothetical protein
MKTVNPSAKYCIFGVRLAVGVDRPRLFDEGYDCEEPRPATSFSEATVEPCL